LKISRACATARIDKIGDGGRISSPDPWLDCAYGAISVIIAIWRPNENTVVTGAGSVALTGGIMTAAVQSKCERLSRDISGRTYFRRTAIRAAFASMSRDVQPLQMSSHSSTMKLNLWSSPFGIVSRKGTSMVPSQHAHRYRCSGTGKSATVPWTVSR
jgi:hypothetical protein